MPQNGGACGPAPDVRDTVWTTPGSSLSDMRHDVAANQMRSSMQGCGPMAQSVLVANGREAMAPFARHACPRGGATCKGVNQNELLWEMQRSPGCWTDCRDLIREAERALKGLKEVESSTRARGCSCSRPLRRPPADLRGAPTRVGGRVGGTSQAPGGGPVGGGVRPTPPPRPGSGYLRS